MIKMVFQLVFCYMYILLVWQTIILEQCFGLISLYQTLNLTNFTDIGCLNQVTYV